jgi:hypothetical protein
MRKPLSTKFLPMTLAASVLVAACSSESPTASVPLSALNGVWSPASPEVPGLSYQFSLTLSGGNVSGTGNWSVGSQSGTVAVTGSASEHLVTLDLTLGHDSPGTLPFLIEHFAGELQSSTTLAGTITFPSGSSQQAYNKIGT